MRKAPDCAWWSLRFRSAVLFPPSPASAPPLIYAASAPQTGIRSFGNAQVARTSISVACPHQPAVHAAPADLWSDPRGLQLPASHANHPVQQRCAVRENQPAGGGGPGGHLPPHRHPAQPDGPDPRQRTGPRLAAPGTPAQALRPGAARPPQAGRPLPGVRRRRLPHGPPAAHRSIEEALRCPARCGLPGLEHRAQQPVPRAVGITVPRRRPGGDQPPAEPQRALRSAQPPLVQHRPGAGWPHRHRTLCVLLQRRGGHHPGHAGGRGFGDRRRPDPGRPLRHPGSAPGHPRHPGGAVRPQWRGGGLPRQRAPDHPHR